VRLILSGVVTPSLVEIEKGEVCRSGVLTPSLVEIEKGDVCRSGVLTPSPVEIEKGDVCRSGVLTPSLVEINNAHVWMRFIVVVRSFNTTGRTHACCQRASRTKGHEASKKDWNSGSELHDGRMERGQLKID
jgi:hypothetical protein